jgi:hypothetical protein
MRLPCRNFGLRYLRAYEGGDTPGSKFRPRFLTYEKPTLAGLGSHPNQNVRLARNLPSDGNESGSQLLTAIKNGLIRATSSV